MDSSKRRLVFQNHNVTVDGWNPAPPEMYEPLQIMLQWTGAGFLPSTVGFEGGNMTWKSLSIPEAWHTFTLLAANFNLISTAFMFQPTPPKKNLCHVSSTNLQKPIISAILFRPPRWFFEIHLKQNWRTCWSSSHEYVPHRRHQIWHQPKLHAFWRSKNPWKIYQQHLHQVWSLPEWVPENWPPEYTGPACNSTDVWTIQNPPSCCRSNAKAPRKGEKAEGRWSPLGRWVCLGSVGFF